MPLGGARLAGGGIVQRVRENNMGLRRTSRPPMMRHPVRSEPMEGEPTQRHKDSAVVRRATLRKQRGSIERATAWIVLFVSVLGSIATLAGGWGPLIGGFVQLQPKWSAIAGGLAIQALLTFLEWYYFDQPMISWPARLADTVLTALGYGPLVLIPLVSLLLTRGVTQAGYVAWLIIGLVSLAIAWYPESRLVD